MSKANQIVEKVIIKKVTNVTTREGQELVILHTTPCRTLKDKDGNAVVRFKLNKKVFDQRAKEVGKPSILFAMDCIGATYEYVAQPVKEGDAFISGEGTYTKAHNAKVSDSITLSALAVAEDARLAKSAYYASMFAPASQVTANPVAISSSNEDVNDGADISA
jgi:hypothetical protein